VVKETINIYIFNAVVIQSRALPTDHISTRKSFTHYMLFRQGTKLHISPPQSIGDYVFVERGNETRQCDKIFYDF